MTDYILSGKTKIETMGGLKDPIADYKRNTYIDHSDVEYEIVREIGAQRLREKLKERSNKLLE